VFEKRDREKEKVYAEEENYGVMFGLGEDYLLQSLGDVDAFAGQQYQSNQSTQLIIPLIRITLPLFKFGIISFI
jgi:hypothetical protein